MVRKMRAWDAAPVERDLMKLLVEKVENRVGGRSGSKIQREIKRVLSIHCRDGDLDLSDNPWTRPPADVVDEGMDAVNDHFDDIFGANDESDRWPPIGYPATEFGLSKFRDAGRLGLHRDAIQAAPRSPFSMILRRRHDSSRPPRPD